MKAQFPPLHSKSSAGDMDLIGHRIEMGYGGKRMEPGLLYSLLVLWEMQWECTIPSKSPVQGACHKTRAVPEISAQLDRAVV